MSKERKIAEMGLTEGWELLTDHIKGYIMSKVVVLQKDDFADLLEVGRCQGGIAELQRVLRYVEKCKEKIKE